MSLIMNIGIGIYAILFGFILWIFSIVLLGLFKKESYNSFSPPISILIPAYNEEKSIEKTIRSLQNAHYPKYEIILIDDGSTDQTVNIAKRFNVKIVKGNHGGKVAALNLGLKHAEYDYIVTIDSDTTIPKYGLMQIVRPLQHIKVGAVSANCEISNASIFQKMEYAYINLIRNSFCKVFGTTVWFFGFFCAYKKEALQKVKGFSKDTVTEDMDITLTLSEKGYLIKTHSLGYTMAPSPNEFFKQRSRWWQGGLQNMAKHKKIWNKNSAMIFLFFNQIWWTVFAFLTFFFTAYQYGYWFDTSPWYTIRWFSAVGPFYVLYKLPVWGLNWYGIFGVLTGVLSTILLCISYIKSTQKDWKTFIGIFFYFPYTLVHNVAILLGFGKWLFYKKKYFIK